MTKSRSRRGKETWRAAESASDGESRQKERCRGGGEGKRSGEGGEEEL